MIYIFDKFELDTDAFELRKNGIKVALEPQVFSVIQFLIENRGRMISKSDLMDAVWNGRIVSEAAIVSRIRSARKALGDTSKPRYMIQTVHGKGFRFIANVTIENGPYVGALTSEASSPGSSTQLPSNSLVLPEGHGRPSIAVLPFENFNNNKEDRYFAAGLTEELIANLSKFHDLLVFSRSTTAALANQDVAISELRQRLGADFAIEGSVRKSDSRVRITFQLIDTVTDGHILVEQFDRDCTLEHVFEIQDKIALLIAARVANRHDLLDEANRHSDRQGRPTTWQTYRSIARYYEYIRIRDPASHAAVRDDLRDTLSRDSSSSDACAALAVVLLDQYRFPIKAHNSAAILTEAHRYARQAVSLDPDHAFAHQALAMVQFYRREFDNFLASVERSIVLNPGKSDALAEFGYCFYMAGDIERALQYLDRSSELNPLEDRIPSLFRAACYFMQDRVQDAMVEIGRSPMPGAYWYHAYLIAISHAAGNRERAEKEAAKMRKQFPNFMTDRLAINETLCVAPEIDEKYVKIWEHYLS